MNYSTISKKEDLPRIFPRETSFFILLKIVEVEVDVAVAYRRILGQDLVFKRDDLHFGSFEQFFHILFSLSAGDDRVDLLFVLRVEVDLIVAYERCNFAQACLDVVAV